MLSFNLRRGLPFDVKNYIFKLAYVSFLMLSSILVFVRTGLSGLSSGKNLLIVAPVVSCLLLKLFSNGSNYYVDGVVESLGSAVAVVCFFTFCFSFTLVLQRVSGLLFYLVLSFILLIGVGKYLGLWGYFIVFNPNHLHFVVVISCLVLPCSNTYRVFGLVAALFSSLLLVVVCLL